MERAQPGVRRRLPLDGDRGGEVGGHPPPLEPEACVRVAEDRGAGLRDQRERAVHEMDLVELGDCLERGPEAIPYVRGRGRPDVHQADVPPERPDDLHVRQLGRDARVPEDGQHDLVRPGDRPPVILGRRERFEEVLELAPFPSRVLADPRGPDAHLVGEGQDAGLVEIQQRRIVAVAHLEPQLPPRVAAVRAREDEPSAGDRLDHPELDLACAAVAGGAGGLDAVLLELAEEASLLEPQALGDLQDDLVPPRVRVRPHVDGDEEDVVGAERVARKGGRDRAVESPAEGDDDRLAERRGADLLEEHGAIHTPRVADPGHVVTCSRGRRRAARAGGAAACERRRCLPQA